MLKYIVKVIVTFLVLLNLYQIGMQKLLSGSNVTRQTATTQSGSKELDTAQKALPKYMLEE